MRNIYMMEETDPYSSSCPLRGCFLEISCEEKQLMAEKSLLFT
ncbi:MAG: hypothetical protein ACLTS6_06505 [Anaerobutyricum sp.]